MIRSTNQFINFPVCTPQNFFKYRGGNMNPIKPFADKIFVLNSDFGYPRENTPAFLQSMVVSMNFPGCFIEFKCPAKNYSIGIGNFVQNIKHLFHLFQITGNTKIISTKPNRVEFIFPDYSWFQYIFYKNFFNISFFAGLYTEFIRIYGDYITTKKNYTINLLN